MTAHALHARRETEPHRGLLDGDKVVPACGECDVLHGKQVLAHVFLLVLRHVRQQGHRHPRVELLEVVRRASVMIQRATPLQLRFAEGELTVIARTHEVGESKESMPIGFTGDALEIGFNADFLRDGLESMDGDDVRFKLISPLRPAVIQGEGDDFTYLVMPIRLPG